MAPKALSAEEKEREKEKEKQKRFNRQINFYYMRHMWQLVCGRSKWNDDDTIYNALNIRRERYTRVIDSGIIRYGKGELDYLVETTGLPKEIFTGEIRFACKYSIEEGTTVAISDKDWKDLFTWRNKRQELRAEKKQAAEGEIKKQLEDKYNCLAQKTQYEKRIYDLLEQVKNAEAENDDFRRLRYFMERREPAPEVSVKKKIEMFTETVNAMGFDILDECTVSELKDIQGLLEAKQTLVSHIVGYKEAQAEKKKK